MKYRLIVVSLVLVAMISTAWGQTHFWSKRFGDASVLQEARSIDVDGDRNILVTGFFDGSVYFGGDTLVSAGGLDLFLVKFDPWGYHLWSKRFGDPDGQSTSKVAVDSQGSVLLAGGIRGNVDFGGGPLTAVNNTDIFVAKFDALGNHIWSRIFGNAGSETARGVAVDPDNNVIITGGFRGSLVIDADTLINTNDTDVFLIKFDDSGNYVWGQSFGSPQDDQVGVGIATGSEGDVFVMGSFIDSIFVASDTLVSAGNQDIFLMKFDAEGNFLWGEGFGDSMTEQCSGIVVDGGDNVVITGSFTGTIDFGGGLLTSAGNQDLFLAKFDSNGDHLWSQRFGDAIWIQTGHSVDVDDDGNLVVSCECRGTTDFGGGPLTSTDPYLPDVTIAKFDASGSHVWSQNYGDENVQYGYSIAADSHGDVSVTGLFRSTVDFGGDMLTSAGGRDVFVVKFSGTATGITPQPTGKHALRTVSYPNPFNPSVTIVYTLPMEASVRVDVYDMAGRHVTRLVNRVETQGDHVVTWDAYGLATGVYLYRIAAGQYSATRKIVLLK